MRSPAKGSLRMSRLLQERGFRPRRWSGMETAQNYRKFAKECHRLANKAEDGEHKRILEQMADVWLRLAAEAEQKGSPCPN